MWSIFSSQPFPRFKKNISICQRSLNRVPAPNGQQSKRNEDTFHYAHKDEHHWQGAQLVSPLFLCKQTPVVWGTNDYGFSFLTGGGSQTIANLRHQSNIMKILPLLLDWLHVNDSNKHDLSKFWTASSSLFSKVQEDRKKIAFFNLIPGHSISQIRR